MKSYDEIMEVLEEASESELSISTASQHSEYGGGWVHLVIVNVDGVVRGVVSRGCLVDALDLAAEKVLTYEEEKEEEFNNVEDLDDDAFDQTVSALESAVSLLRRVRR